MKTVELFAGVGGFRCGVEGSELASVFETVWSNQWEPGAKNQFASDIYRHVFGDDNHVNEDINKVIADIPEHELLLGGFPCQDYSVAKRLDQSKGIEGEKGVLWWSMYELLRQKLEAGTPVPYLMLENVDRLISSPSKAKGRDFGVILASLHGLGYCAEWRVINAGDYDFAQSRKRTFIMAYHKDSPVEQLVSGFDSQEQYLFDLNGQGGLMQSAFPMRPRATEKLEVFELPGDAYEISHDNESFNSKKSRFMNAGIMDSEGKIWTQRADAFTDLKTEYSQCLNPVSPTYGSAVSEVIELYQGNSFFDSYLKPNNCDIDNDEKAYHVVFSNRDKFCGRLSNAGKKQIELFKQVQKDNAISSYVEMVVAGISSYENIGFCPDEDVNDYWASIYQYTRDEKPPFVFLEVDDGVSSAKLKNILKSFDSLGYSVEFRKYSRSEFHDSWLILAMNGSTHQAYSISQDEFLVHPEGMEDLDDEGYAEMESQGFAGYLRNQSILNKGKEVQFFLEESAVIDNFSINDGQIVGIVANGYFIQGEYEILDDEQRASQALRDVVLSDELVADEFWIKDEETLARWEYLKGAKRIPRTRKDGSEYFFTEGAMNFPDSLDRTARTILTSEGGASASRTTHIIQSEQSGRYRRLTPVELERLNNFADNHTQFASQSIDEAEQDFQQDLFAFESVNASRETTPRERAFCMGNSLVTGVVTKLAKSLHELHSLEQNRKAA